MRLFIILLANFIMFLPVAAYAATTFEDIFDLSEFEDVLTDKLPPTCEPEFWDVLQHRAWEEGEREVIQNGNLLAKPDSIIMYSCFDKYLDNISEQSDINYPGDPNYAMKNSFLGFGRFAFRTVREVFNLPLKVDPFPKNKFNFWNVHMESALELLILDTLVPDVSYLQVFDGSWEDGAFDINLCHRDYYIQSKNRDDAIDISNYQHNILGNRGVYRFIPDNQVNEGFSCDVMAQVWNEAKCYNANTEADHDGYYSFEAYYSRNGNYRKHIAECKPLKTLEEVLDTYEFSDYLGAACEIYFHGLPALPVSYGWLADLLATDPPKADTWGSAYPGANPPPGSPGAMGPLATMRDLYDPMKCTDYAPIKTGVVIKPKEGDPYDDAYCMAPGCWYNHEVSTTRCQAY